MEQQITRPLEVIETEINFYKQQTASGIIEIGKRLIEAKAQLQHGEWGKWLDEKVDFSLQTAQRFMKVYSEFGNTSALRDFNKTQIFALLSLPTEDREEFMKENPVADMTTRQLQEAIKAKKDAEQKIHILETNLKEAQNKQPEVKIVEKIVDKTDYNTIRSLQQQLHTKDYDLEKLKRDRDLLERKVKLNEDDAKKFNDLKSQIEFLSKEKQDIARQIQSATELSGLVIKIDNMLKTELAPIRYSRTLERMDSDVAIENLTDIIESVEAWCMDMRKFLPNNNIIDAEVIR